MSSDLLQLARTSSGDLPAKGDEGLAVLLVELPAIELLDEIRANVVGAGQRFVAAEPVDLAVIAAGKDRRNRDASPRGRLGVLMVFQQCVAARVRTPRRSNRDCP